MKVIIELSNGGDVEDVRRELFLAKQIVNYIYDNDVEATVELTTTKKITVQPATGGFITNPDPNKYLIKNTFDMP